MATITGIAQIVARYIALPGHSLDF